eukprot:scaffold736_cov197-Ochromonas_danica.AAC.2
MEIGVEVWIKDHLGDLAWIAATVIAKEEEDTGNNNNSSSSDKCKVLVRTDYGEEHNFIVAGGGNEDNDSIKLRNKLSDSLVENLINLPYLHEPAILFCLQQRYQRGEIYTYTGPILIALNPFKSVPLYTTQILEVYYNSGLLRSQGIDVGAPLAPHVFAIADAAYREMMKFMLPGHHLFHTNSGSAGSGSSGSNHNNNALSAAVAGGAVSADQSILISGESGAGKTESTKIVLRYLTTVGNSAQTLELVTGSIMDKVLQSNPILEAFGNARTNRNDNSSRFGKFIELNFNKRGSLIGGKIRTYLLEKVRLPLQQPGERNFHIFYQLFAGNDEDEQRRWQLEPIEHYDYLAHGGIYSLQSIDDGRDFLELKKALTILRFEEEDQKSLFDAIAGILHLGQVRFLSVTTGEGEGSVLNQEETSSVKGLERFCSLCGLSQEAVLSTLTLRLITARGETYEKKLNAIQATDARDAVAKAIYGKAFDWIVLMINKCMEVDKASIRATIGVLDIFGFESFQHNSFEQLCINYTNETLQQQFNQYIFKMEQLEYERERIEWSFIAFPDNKDCLDLIEHRTNGLLAMIDDECRLPKPSDEKLANRMYKQFQGHKRFQANAVQKRDSKFAILHYAGGVEYSTMKFVDKNKDELPKEAMNLLNGSSIPLLSVLFAPSLPDLPSSSSSSSRRVGPGGSAHRSTSIKGGSGGGGGGGGSGGSTTSVGIQFKEQLNSLMESIYSTTPHYIRCIKPNDRNEADNFHRLRVTEQLRYGGVLEAVRVARSGFPVRLSHGEFFARYRLILTAISSSSSSSITTTLVLPMYIPVKERGSAAKVKEYCDGLLRQLWEICFVRAVVHGSSIMPPPPPAPPAGGSNHHARESIQLGLTKVFLRKDAHDVLESYRSRQLNQAATRIQATFRCQQSCKWYHSLAEAVRLLQRVVRGSFARRRARHLRHTVAAQTIQSCYRGYAQRCAYRKIRWAVIAIQCYRRRVVAQRLFSTLFYQAKAQVVTSFLRGSVQRRHYLAYRKAVVALQCRHRRHLAKALLKQLRMEAKDLGRLQQSNDSLKQEIENLKLKALEEKERMRLELEQQMRESASHAKEEELAKLREAVARLEEQLEEEKQLRMAAEDQITRLTVLLDEEIKKTLTTSCAVCVKNAEAFEVRINRYDEQLTEAYREISVLRGEVEKASKALLAATTPSSSSSSPVKTSSTMAAAHQTRLPPPPPPPATSAMVEGSDSLLSGAAGLQRTVSRRRTFTGSIEQQQQQQHQQVIGADGKLHGAVNIAHYPPHHPSSSSSATPSAEDTVRRALEEEVSRLRKLSLEQQAVIESYKTSPPPAPPAPPAAPSSAGSTSVPGPVRHTMTGRGLPIRRLSTRTPSAAGGELSDMAAPPPPNTYPHPPVSPASEQLWSKAWDEEDDSSETGSVQGQQPPPPPPAPPAPAPPSREVADNTIKTFERNLEVWKMELRHGNKARLWEGDRVANVEVIVKLDPSTTKLLFDTSHNR